jgi:peptidoglycan/xylan/chitin deacetylase (PgdA/CDA1 family)
MASMARKSDASEQNSKDSAMQDGFFWPGDRRVAVSLSFDDARSSQLDVAIPLLEGYGVKATFYVCPQRVEERPDDWRAVHAAGHELGNHTVNHPCSGNFEFSRDRALEEYTLEDMEQEMLECNRRVEAICGCVPRTFAYPCGNTFVGRGAGAQSYVPLVAKHFLAGRGYPSEWHNAPDFCDLAQINGVSMDNMAFAQALALIERTRDVGGWLVLAGHDAGSEAGRQVTRSDMLQALCDYALAPDKGVWLDTVAAVAEYIRDWRQEQEKKGATHHVSG